MLGLNDALVGAIGIVLFTMAFGFMVGVIFACEYITKPAIFLPPNYHDARGLEPQALPDSGPSPQPTVINNNYSPTPVMKSQPVTLTQPSFQPELKPTDDPNRYNWKAGGHS